MKSCYWCELAGEPSQHPDDEIGGIDADTEKWICGDCADLGEPVSSLTPDAADGGNACALTGCYFNMSGECIRTECY